MIVVADDASFVEHRGNAGRPHAAGSWLISSMRQPLGWSRSFVLAALRALHLDQRLRADAFSNESLRLDSGVHTGNDERRRPLRSAPDRRPRVMTAGGDARLGAHLALGRPVSMRSDDHGTSGHDEGRLPRARRVLLTTLTVEVTVFVLTGIALFFVYRPSVGQSWPGLFARHPKDSWSIRFAAGVRLLHQLASASR